jgi:small subunit ribosomal protein S13
MVRIAGINLPNNKRTEAALLAVYGVGRSLAKVICANAKVNPDKRAVELNEDEENRLRAEVAKVQTEGELRRQISGNIKMLQDISCYRGVRHKKRLPVRGQRTKTNSRTRKGKRKTMGSGRVKEQKK